MPDLGELQYTPSGVGLDGVSASYRPWAWDAPCVPADGLLDAALLDGGSLDGGSGGGGSGEWCFVNGSGRYGLRHTALPSPVLSGQCDPSPHSTLGELCDLPRVFSFVFPAVVGMMEGADPLRRPARRTLPRHVHDSSLTRPAGANLSGDLRDPASSIPAGTVCAVSTAFLCYLLLIFGQAGSVDRGARQHGLSATPRRV